MIKICIFALLLVSFALGDVYQASASGSAGWDREGDSYDKYENAGKASDSDHAEDSKYRVAQDRKSYDDFNRDKGNKKFQAADSDRKSKFSDKTSRSKNVKSREQDDFDKKKNQLSFDKASANKVDKRKDTRFKNAVNDVDKMDKNAIKSNKFKKNNAKRSGAKSFADHSEADDDMSSAQAAGSSGSYGSTGSAGANKDARKHWQKHKMGNERDDSEMNAVEAAQFDKSGKSKLSKKNRLTDFDQSDRKSKMNQDKVAFDKNDVASSQRRRKKFDSNEDQDHATDKFDKASDSKKFKDSNYARESGKKYDKASNSKSGKQSKAGRSSFKNHADRKKTIGRDVGHGKW